MGVRKFGFDRRDGRPATIAADRIIALEGDCLLDGGPELPHHVPSPCSSAAWSPAGAGIHGAITHGTIAVPVGPGARLGVTARRRRAMARVKLTVLRAAPANLARV